MTGITTRPYRLDVSDHIAFAVDNSYRPLITFPGVITYPLSILFVVGMINAPALIKGEYTTTFLWTGALLILWMGIIPGLRVWLIWKSTKGNPSATALRTLRADDGGVHVHGDGFEARLTWQSFQKIIETKSYVLLMRFSEAHIVPLSAFATLADAQSFAEQARSHIANAKHVQTAIFYDDQPNTQVPSPQNLHAPPFRLTFRTFACLSLRLNLRTLYHPLTVTGLFVLWAAVYGWLYRYDLMDGYWNDAIRSASIPAVVYLLLPILSVLLGWQKTRNMPVVTNERHVAISPEEIHATGHGYDVRFAWRDLKRVEQFGGVMLFYTPPQGAIPLPNSAFADKIAAQVFYDQALAYFNAAKAPATKSALDG